MTNTAHDYPAIVRHALTEPGKMSESYRAFHRYSIGNQFLAMMQLAHAEPINTYNGWKQLGRQVKKGSKAIALLMPVTVKGEDSKGKETVKAFFIRRNNWFGLSQTEGADYVAPVVPGFSVDTALKALEITQEAYKSVNGNCMGYAKPLTKTIAVSPLAFNPLKTTLHEIAHCILHADDVSLSDMSELPSDVKEVEAELTAYIALSVLGQIEGLEYSRGYLASWNSGNAGDKVRYGKVFSAADAILKAGRPEVATEAE